jgi:predicted double-glycine peptidase
LRLSLKKRQEYSGYQAQGATLTDFIYTTLTATRHLNGCMDNKINKLNIVLKAKEIGLPIGMHFIVVYRTAKQAVYVTDPSIGLMMYSIEEFIRGWTGVKDN